MFHEEWCVRIYMVTSCNYIDTMYLILIFSVHKCVSPRIHTHIAAAQAVKELDDMSSQEKDIRYNHVFQYVAMQLSDFIVSDVGSSSSTNINYALIKCGLTLSGKLRECMQQADSALSKSSIASLLPAVEYREKLMVAASKLLRECGVVIVVIDGSYLLWLSSVCE